MTELSDQMYDALKLDIYKMKNVALNEAHKQNEQYADDIAQFIVLEILLQVVGLRYESVIEHMQKIFQTDYDKMYYNSSAKNVLAAFDKAKSEFSKRYVATEINPNKMRGLITGIHAILNKMEKLIKGDLKGDVMKEIDEYDPGDDLFVSCVDMLGLNSNYKRDE